MANENVMSSRNVNFHGEQSKTTLISGDDGHDDFRYDHEGQSDHSDDPQIARLKQAILSGNLESVDAIFRSPEFETTCLTKYGPDLIRAAILSRQLAIVRYLYERNVPIRIRDEGGETALHLAARLGILSIVEYLVTTGINLTVVDKKRHTPLLCAVCSESANCVQVLLKAGARIDATDENGNSALHLACLRGNYVITQIICAAFPDLNAHNSSGLTPLHLASKMGHVKTVRYLLLSGADPRITSRNGIAPDVMAFAQGHWKVGMLLTKMKPERRKVWVEQLKANTHRLPRIKLKLFGSTLVGKTQLAQSLRTGPISAYLRKKLSSVSELTGRNGEQSTYYQIPRNYAPYRWNIDAQHENYTMGIDIQPTNEFSIWDFSGFEPYYCFYDHFIGDTSCLHLVLFSLLDTPEWRRASVRFWLDFLYARIPINGPLLFGGRPVQAARVILVATHADCVPCLRDINGLYTDDGAINLALEMRNEYKYKLDVHEIVYVLDARDATSPELKQLKSYLTECQNLILQMLPRTNSLLLEVANHLADWTKDNSFPVDNIDQFAARVHEHINPLCTDEHLSSLIQHLQYTGNIIYVESNAGDDMIILDPNWLCSNSIGNCFSERSMHRVRITGSYTLDDLQLVVRVQNTVKVVNLLESLGLIVCCVVHEKHVRNKSKKSQQAKDCFEQFEQASGSAKSIAKTSSQSKSTIVSTQFVFDINKLDQLDPSMEVQIEMPRLNLIPMYDGLWDTDRNQTMRYMGVRISATPGHFIHLLPSFHTHLRRKVSALPNLDNKLNLSQSDEFSDLDNLMEKYANSPQHWDLVLCLHASKVTGHKGEIEMLINLDEEKQDICIRVRCTLRQVRRTFRLLHDTIHLMSQVIHQYCPSLEYHLNYLSSSDLKQHHMKPREWDPIQLTKALSHLFDRSPHDSQSQLSPNQKLDRLASRDDVSPSKPEFDLFDDVFLGDQQLAQSCSSCLDLPAYPLSTALYQKLASLIDLDEQNADNFIRLAESLCYPDIRGLVQQWRYGSSVQSTLSPTASLLNYAAKYSLCTLEWALKSTYGSRVLRYLYTDHILLNFSHLSSRCKDCFEESCSKICRSRSPLRLDKRDSHPANV